MLLKSNLDVQQTSLWPQTSDVGLLNIYVWHNYHNKVWPKSYIGHLYILSHLKLELSASFCSTNQPKGLLLTSSADIFSLSVCKNWISKILDKFNLTGQNLSWVFNLRIGCKDPVHLHCFEAKLPNLKLKTQSEQLLGSLPLDFALPSKIQNPAAKNCRMGKCTRWCLDLIKNI